MASLKESGTIEYEADWIGILAAVEEDENGGFHVANNWEQILLQKGNVDLIVLKAKGGTGNIDRIPLKMDKDKMIISDRPLLAILLIAKYKKIKL